MRTDAIWSPPITNGLEAITQVPVRDFACAYENVYAFCLSDKPKEPARTFRCSWLVGMSEKATGSLRVGCGTYDWSFDTERPHPACRPCRRAGLARQGRGTRRCAFLLPSIRQYCDGGVPHFRAMELS
jgi:hypothetical protein